jgi:hypothetical protein
MAFQCSPRRLQHRILKGFAASGHESAGLGWFRWPIYDFTENQSRNHLRSRRLLLRGSHGEINDDRVIRWADAETIIESRIVRRQSGYELDHEGFDTAHLSLDGEVLWRNPFFGHRLNDEDIAMSTTLLGMAHWVRGEAPPPTRLRRRRRITSSDSRSSSQPMRVVS